MIRNTVEMEMGNKYSFSIITKEDNYKVLVIFYNATVTIYGGRNLDIPKIYKHLPSKSDAYNKFMYITGKMCKKENDDSGHYFSELAVDTTGKPWVSEKIPDSIDNIRKDIIKNIL